MTDILQQVGAASAGRSGAIAANETKGKKMQIVAGARAFIKDMAGKYVGNNPLLGGVVGNILDGLDDDTVMDWANKIASNPQMIQGLLGQAKPGANVPAASGSIYQGV